MWLLQFRFKTFFSYQLADYNAHQLAPSLWTRWPSCQTGSAHSSCLTSAKPARHIVFISGLQGTKDTAVYHVSQDDSPKGPGKLHFGFRLPRPPFPSSCGCSSLPMFPEQSLTALYRGFLDPRHKGLFPTECLLFHSNQNSMSGWLAWTIVCRSGWS